MWVYWTIGTLSALVIGIATNFWEVINFPIVASPMMIFGNVIWESMMQSEVPRDLLGRASSVDWFVSLGIAPLGLVIAGEIANYVGVRAYFVAFCVICVLPGLFILKSKRMNEIDKKRVNPAPTAELQRARARRPASPFAHRSGRSARDETIGPSPRPLVRLVLPPTLLRSLRSERGPRRSTCDAVPSGY